MKLKGWERESSECSFVLSHSFFPLAERYKILTIVHCFLELLLMTEQCKRYNRRFRFFFFSFVNFLCSRRIYGSTNLCFCRCLTMFIPSFGTAWKHWACVAVFFFFCLMSPFLCLRFYANSEGIPNEKEFCKIFYFYTVTCCYLDLFQTSLAFCFSR